jgi:hypothetical protein
VPRARVPRTAIEYLDVVDKRGVANLCRIFGCSRRAADQLIAQARRCVAQGLAPIRIEWEPCLPTQKRCSPFRLASYCTAIMGRIVRSPSASVHASRDRRDCLVGKRPPGARQLLSGRLLTLPGLSIAVRRCPSVQVDGLYLSAGVASERQKSERLAVTLAVSLLPL